MVKNGPKSENRSTMVINRQYSQKKSKAAKNGQKGSQTVKKKYKKNCQQLIKKTVNNGQYSKKQSKTTKKQPKTTKNVKKWS